MNSLLSRKTCLNMFDFLAVEFILQLEVAGLIPSTRPPRPVRAATPTCIRGQSSRPNTFNFSRSPHLAALPLRFRSVLKTAVNTRRILHSALRTPNSPTSHAPNMDFHYFYDHPTVRFLSKSPIVYSSLRPSNLAF